MNLTDYITVMQVFELMGINPDRHTSWAVGGKVARMFADENGHQPPKDNRPKTSGGGSHCFALYPRSWIPRIKDVIKSETLVRPTQTTLFNDEE